MSTPRSTQRSGFTLIETVVAISILMLGMLGPMYLAQRSLKASREAGDKLTASFLAQEGIEMVRNYIANNSADNQPWLNDLALGGPPARPCEGRPCIVDISIGVDAFPSNPFIVCNPPNGPNACNNNSLIYQDASGVMRQPDPGVGWTPTKFRRRILVERTATDLKRASTTVIVNWGNSGAVVLQEDIYNWFFQLN